MAITLSQVLKDHVALVHRPAAAEFFGRKRARVTITFPANTTVNEAILRANGGAGA